MTIPVGVRGKIRNSEHDGHIILVQDDKDATGGFLIYEWWIGSAGPNEHAAFDSWAKDETSIEAYIAEADWQVDWDNTV